VLQSLRLELKNLNKKLNKLSFITFLKFLDILHIHGKYFILSRQIVVISEGISSKFSFKLADDEGSFL